MVNTDKTSTADWEWQYDDGGDTQIPYIPSYNSWWPYTIRITIDKQNQLDRILNKLERILDAYIKVMDDKE